MTENKNSTFARWYEKNQAALSERRKKRYQQDSAYRDKCKKRARQYRRDKKGVVGVPEGYTHSFREAAEELEISAFVLRDWGLKDYYPKPVQVGGRFYFTAHQVCLIHQIKQFIDTHGARLSTEKKEDLKVITATVYANWQE